MKAAIIIVIVLIVAAVFMGMREGKKDQRRRAAEFSRLVSIAGPEDTIYVGKTIDFTVEAYTLIGKGCTIEFNPEMAGPSGVRLVRSGVINLEGGAEVTIKDCNFIDWAPYGDPNKYFIKIEGPGVIIEDCNFIGTWSG